MPKSNRRKRRAARRLPSDLPRVRVVRAIERLGFAFDREGGDHTVYKDPSDPDRLLVVPRHARVKR
jgi:predicted RNA binding protein YcfA (HicA-like mRNA interferase family)